MKKYLLIFLPVLAVFFVAIKTPHKGEHSPAGSPSTNQELKSALTLRANTHGLGIISVPKMKVTEGHNEWFDNIPHTVLPFTQFDQKGEPHPKEVTIIELHSDGSLIRIEKNG